MGRLFIALLLMVLPAVIPAAAAPAVRIVVYEGPVTPVTSLYFRECLKDAASAGDQLVLIELDTPGGLDSAMREIVKDILASPVPVAVYVAPSGARAASAGAVISLAADLLAMAPGTAIGAAHPVSLGEKPDKVMQEKQVNDAEAYLEGLARQRGRNPDLAKRMVRESLSLPAETAQKEGIADLLARDRADLLRQLEGRRIVHRGVELTLHPAGAPVTESRMGLRERVLAVIGDPNIAYLLLLLGFIGIYLELANPGLILPGVVGGIALILAFFALQTLPVNYAGVLLILFALILFVAEVKVVSHGILGIGGTVALVFGGMLLFPSADPSLRVSRGVLAASALVTAAFFAFVVSRVLAAQRTRPVSGVEGIVGERGAAVGPVSSGGKIFVRGEYWDARSDEPVEDGEEVVVIAVEGMRLKVKKA